jgi:hypothetical protein
MPIFDFSEDPPLPDDRFGFSQPTRLGFLDATDATNCVIITRTPGRAASQLIAERYDLKGYFVKAKSCNWGPMAGFICMIPEFSKNNAQAGFDFNRKMHMGYLKTLAAMGPKQEPVAHPHIDPSAEQYRVARARAFVPLVISQTQKNLVMASVSDYDAKTGVGIAVNEKSTVATEFYLQPITLPTQEPGFALHHGNVYKRANDKAEWKRIQFAAQDVLAPEYSASIKLERDPRVSLSGFRKKFKFTEQPELFCPIMGAQNPYPSYPERDKEFPGGRPDTYKNAVAGDYDIFAFWPLREDIDRELQRAAEVSWIKKWGDPNIGPLPPDLPLFRPIPGKPLAVASTKCPALYVEFVLTGDQLGPLEDDAKGNISPQGEWVVGMLNSCVHAQYKKARELTYIESGRDPRDKYPPNASFHSDDGGRPGVKDIEFDIAVFLPRKLSRALKLPDTARAFVIVKKEGRDAQEKAKFLQEARDNFLKLIEPLLRHCVISLSSGWMMDMMADKDQQLRVMSLLLSGSIHGLEDENIDTKLTPYIQNLFQTPPEPDPENPGPPDPELSAVRKRLNAALAIRTLVRPRV